MNRLNPAGETRLTLRGCHGEKPTALLLVLILVSAGCGTTSAKSLPPAPVAQPRRDCTAAAPCDGIRQQWFANEVKDAELWATYCHPPAPGKADDCRGLDGAIAALHRLNFHDFSDFCGRFSGKPSTAVYPFVGHPDRDETSPCGSAQCRVWIWYWFGGGQYGIFTILLGLPPGAADWLLQRCNYCTPSGCEDMSFTP
jgi:hypothetical protein